MNVKMDMEEHEREIAVLRSDLKQTFVPAHLFDEDEKVCRDEIVFVRLETIMSMVEENDQCTRLCLHDGKTLLVAGTGLDWMMSWESYEEFESRRL